MIVLMVEIPVHVNVRVIVGTGKSISTVPVWPGVAEMVVVVVIEPV